MANTQVLERHLRSLELKARGIRESAERRARVIEDEIRVIRSVIETLGSKPVEVSPTAPVTENRPIPMANVSADVYKGAMRSTRGTLAQQKLYEGGQTVSGLARELGEGRPRVNSWFATDSANRSIPRNIALKLEKKYGIPLTAWKRIAD